MTPDDVSQWGLHCYCIQAVATPQRIIRMDDNGKILSRARAGATVRQLRAEGLRASDSQLTLLQMFGLLSKEGAALQTTIPLLGPQTILAARARAARLAGKLTPVLASSVQAIRKELGRRGLFDSEYAVVFGYSLDTLLWEQLEHLASLPPTALTVQQPLWRGAFWAIYPERSGAAGTNEVVQGNVRLTTVWTDPVAERLRQFARAPSTMAALVAIERSASSAEMAGLETARLGEDTASNGRLLVPVIRAKTSDPLHAPSTQIASVIARALLSTDDGRELIQMVPNATHDQALVIVAHELIWEVADALVTAQVLTYPTALRPAANTTPLAPLLLVRVAG